jgi:hypothetical protein
LTVASGPPQAPVSGPPQAPRGSRLRRWAPLLGIAALIVALGVVASGGTQGGALDPNGTSPQGAKALVLLLRRYGAQVSIEQGVPGADVGAAVVLSDRLDATRRAALEAWVRAGGHLVVTDPGSPLQVGAATALTNGLTTKDLHPGGGCDLPGASGVRQLSVGSSLMLRVPPGTAATTCFDYQLSDREQASFLVAVPVGSGLVVGLGGAGLWTNQRLDQLDNAALAVGLLSPADGAHVDVLVASLPGSGHRTVFDLLSPRLKWALLQLAVAFGVLAWWRGRRFGRPIPETGPVQLAGSEIVVAVGDLMARTSNRDAAARQLREGACSRIGAWLGLGPGSSPELVADALAARLGIPRARTLALLSDPVVDDTALVRLAQSLADLSQEVTRGRSAERT